MQKRENKLCIHMGTYFVFMHSFSLGKLCYKKNWKISVSNLKVSFILLYVFVERPELGVGCRAAPCGADRNAGLRQGFLSLPAAPTPNIFIQMCVFLSHSLILLPPTAFLRWISKALYGSHRNLPEARRRVKGAFDWPLLPRRYVYLPHG